LDLIEPLDGAVIPLAPTNFSWTPMPAVNRYIIQIARDDNFTDMIFEYDASTSKLMLNQSFGAGEFYWRVASVLNGISLKFSNVRKFTR
jgi:hypothetical protein